MVLRESICVAYLIDVEIANDEYYMKEALRQARRAFAADEVPVGAVIVREGQIIARAWNQVEMLKDATAHAEMLAITQAEAAMEDWRLTDCDLYVTKEPCPMCSGAVLMARVKRVCYAVPDPKMGCLGGATNLNDLPRVNHHVELTVGGVLETECRELLQTFFKLKRAAE